MSDEPSAAPPAPRSEPVTPWWESPAAAAGEWSQHDAPTVTARPAPPAPMRSRRTLGRNAVIAASTAAVVVALGGVGWAVYLRGGEDSSAAPGPSASPTPEPRPYTPAPDESDEPSPSPPTDTGRRTDTPSPDTRPSHPDDIVALPGEAAEELLAEWRTADASAVAAIPHGTWVAQLSSKCRWLERADLYDSSGRRGYPDGNAESYRPLLGDNQIAAFHAALKRRMEFAGVVLTTPAAVGSSAVVAACRGSTMWITLAAAIRAPDSGTILSWCAAQGLPAGECGARRFSPGGGSDYVGND